VRPEAIAEATEACPYCNGTGTVSPTLLIDKQIENMVAYYAEKKGIRNLTVKASPYVSAFLLRGFPSSRLRWMWKYKCFIRVRTDQAVGVAETKIVDVKGRELN
jgi:ribonuclease G